MAREDHQPDQAPVERLERDRAEMRGVCGRTIAVILATDEATTPLSVQFDEPGREPFAYRAPVGQRPVARPLQEFEGRPAVCHAVKAAVHAQTAMVYVLAAPSIVEGVTRAAHSVKRKGTDPVVDVLECDLESVRERTREAADFEMFGIPYGILEIVRALVHAAPGGADTALVMSADAVRVRSDHLFELCRDAQEDPGFDAIASWISWLRRPPFLLSRSFLEGLEGCGLTAAGPDGRRPVARLSVRDHVFGEEKLEANATVPAGAAAFGRSCSMGALQAVALARHGRRNPESTLYSPNQPLSLMGPVAPRPLGSSDRLLVELANKVAASASALGASEAAELAWADAFGSRNRRDFPLLNDRAHAGKLAYLDSAATAQRLASALQAQRDYDEHENANVYRGAYELSARSTFTLNDARKRLEDFIGAGRRQTVLVANTTAAVNLVAQAWGEWNIGAGDLIVVPLAEHHSNMLPFAMLAERKGAHVEYLPYGPDGRLDQEAYRAALERGPKLVAMAQIGNVFGIVEPVREMAAAAHDAGARFLVDAAQSFPHMKIDVNDLGADWVALSGHKAYGPMGIGALWISPEAFDEMDPVGGGGGTVSHVALGSYYLRPKALQYEMGTPPVSQAVGLAAAVDYLDGLGMENVERHAAALTRYLVRGLQAADGVRVIGDHSREDGQTGLVSFTLRGIAPSALAGFLGSLDVAIRAGGHCALPLHASMGLIGTGRISIGVYTTRDDIDAALIAIEACRRAYEG